MKLQRLGIYQQNSIVISLLSTYEISRNLHKIVLYLLKLISPQRGIINKSYLNRILIITVKKTPRISTNSLIA